MTGGGYLASVAAAPILVFSRIVSRGTDFKSIVGRNPICFSSYPLVSRTNQDLRTVSHSSFNDPILSTSSSGIMVDRSLIGMLEFKTREIENREVLTPCRLRKGRGIRGRSRQSVGAYNRSGFLRKGNTNRTARMLGCGANHCGEQRQVHSEGYKALSPRNPRRAAPLKQRFNEMVGRLEGKVAIVTGGGHGFGLGIVEK